MIRKLLLPAACAVLLGGCVTGYGYSDGYGDGGYYYGQPSVRYYGGASYGYPYSSYGYGGTYGSPYGYGGYRSYGYPYAYYPRYRYPRGHHRDGHDHNRPGRGDHDHDRGDGQGRNDNRRPPWRDWAGDIGRERRANAGPRPDGRLEGRALPSRVDAPRPAIPPRADVPRPMAPPRAMPERAMPRAIRNGGLRVRQQEP